MKNKYFYSLVMVFFALILPVKVYAFEHGYQRKTEDIYATVRHDVEVYADDSGDTLMTVLSPYIGIRVTYRGDSWYQIEYDSKEDGTKIGWITKDSFYADCLIYDGRDKQRVADGDYEMKYSGEDTYDITQFVFKEAISLPDIFQCNFTYLGNGLYSIVNIESGEYLQPDPMFTINAHNFWGKEESAGQFYVKRKGDYFTIQDRTTRRYLGKSNSGIICFEFDNQSCWRLTRYNKATQQDSLRVFAQFDAEWAAHYYGPGVNDNPRTNIFCTSACGIFATMNAIYASTGMYADPYAMGDYAVEKGYRILDNGTDDRFFKAAAEEYGDKYGFTYDGSGGSIDQLIKKLKAGDVAIVHVPGHYVSIVTYNEKTKKFLLLDSHYLPKRATNAYGDWVSISDLESGNLTGYMYYYYKGVRPKTAVK